MTGAYYIVLVRGNHETENTYRRRISKKSKWVNKRFNLISENIKDNYSTFTYSLKD